MHKYPFCFENWISCWIELPLYCKDIANFVFHEKNGGEIPGAGDNQEILSRWNF